MRCPTLNELPPPPPGKTGWPWTIECPKLPGMTPDGSPWPRISIVTPSFNQGQFIEETIRSVLLQGYQDLEYFILDGGSTDGAVEIIIKYEKWLKGWRSSPDGGQSACINEGFEKCNGEIYAWINSDDGYLPGALTNTALAFMNKDCEIVVGNSVYKDQNEARYVQTMPIRPVYLCRPGHIPQHSTFWRSSIHENIGERIQCAMDTELWLRLFPKAKRCIQVPIALAFVNCHHDQKSSSISWEAAQLEDRKIIEKKHARFRWFNKKIIRKLAISLRILALCYSPKDGISDAQLVLKKLSFSRLVYVDCRSRIVSISFVLSK